MNETDLKQRLCAILAADVTGYSRLMAADERETVAALDSARKVFRSHIESSQGRVIDMAGDSVLAMFETVIGAVSSALAIQKEINLACEQVPEDRRMRFRIGVHLGDVMEKADGTIYGDGVNIAARLEGLAEPGGITISAAVRSVVRGKVAASFVDQGEQQVKNIPHPVRAFALRVEGDIATIPASAAAETAPSLPDKPSIAVLPFANMSGDPEQEYFADGITEDILTELASVSGLLVIARNSSFVFKNQAVDIKEVGRRFGVRHVLEGSVRKAGSRVRITAQLIDAQTGGHVWAERFDRELEDIFAVQDEVTRNIVNALKVRLTGSGRAHRGKVNAAAYDLVMRARRSFFQFTPEGMDETRTLLNRALEIDSNLASAYALLAQIDAAEYVNGWDAGGLEHLERGMKFARKALELDPEEERAYQAIASLALWRKDYGSAEQAARRALELAPNYSGGFMALGQVLDFSGRHTEAIEAFEQALRIDPGYDIILNFLGRAQFGAGFLIDAENSFRRRLVHNPRSDMSRAYLASLLGSAGRVEIARRLWSEIFEINPHFSLEHLRRVLPYKDPAWFEHFVDGLRKAGVTQSEA